MVICKCEVITMTSNERDILAYNIKFLRKKNRMTQTEVARKLGVRQTTVSEWEKGRSEPDSVALLKKICSLFDVTFDQILNEHIDNYEKDQEKIGGAIARKLENLSENERNQAEQDILSFLRVKYGNKE